MSSREERALVSELAERGAPDREVFRLGNPRLTLVALVTGTVLGFVGVIGLLLGWLGGPLEELSSVLLEYQATPPEVTIAVLAVAAILWLIGLARSVVLEVEVEPGGAAVFKALFKKVTADADDPLALDRLLGFLLVRAPGGQMVLLPELACNDRLLAHLDAHPTSVSDSGSEGEGSPLARPEPVARERLDTSAWRIVRTSSLAFSMALYGLAAGAVIPALGVGMLLATGGETIRPDGSVRPLSEFLWFAAVTGLMPPAVVAPVVVFRVLRWRAILERGEPVPGRIDEVSRASGELLLRFSFEQAGRRQRIKLLLRPTAAAKALRPGAQEVVWVRPDRPRQALPQRLFLRRDEGFGEA